jgi:hypothetical protein
MKATHSVCVLKLPTCLESNSQNCPGGVALVAGAGHLVDWVSTHLPVVSSNTPYSLPVVTPFKFEAHLGLPRGYCSPQPLPLIHFL